jgi:hypothetical protein
MEITLDFDFKTFQKLMYTKFQIETNLKKYFWPNKSNLFI